jgi:hypothetical protein
MSTGDEILRATSTISSIRANVPNDFEVEESWVAEFNSAVDKVGLLSILTSKSLRSLGASLYRSVATSN